MAHSLSCTLIKWSLSELNANCLTKRLSPILRRFPSSCCTWRLLFLRLNAFLYYSIWVSSITLLYDSVEGLKCNKLGFAVSYFLIQLCQNENIWLLLIIDDSVKHKISIWTKFLDDILALFWYCLQHQYFVHNLCIFLRFA